MRVQRYFQIQPLGLGHGFLGFRHRLDDLIDILVLLFQSDFTGFQMRQVKDIIDQTVETVNIGLGPA